MSQGTEQAQRNISAIDTSTKWAIGMLVPGAGFLLGFPSLIRDQAVIGLLGLSLCGVLAAYHLRLLMQFRQDAVAAKTLRDDAIDLLTSGSDFFNPFHLAPGSPTLGHLGLLSYLVVMWLMPLLPWFVLFHGIDGPYTVREMPLFLGIGITAMYVILVIACVRSICKTAVMSKLLFTKRRIAVISSVLIGLPLAAIVGVGMYLGSLYILSALT